MDDVGKVGVENVAEDGAVFEDVLEDFGEVVPGLISGTGGVVGLLLLLEGLLLLLVGCVAIIDVSAAVIVVRLTSLLFLFFYLPLSIPILLLLPSFFFNHYRLLHLPPHLPLLLVPLSLLFLYFLPPHSPPFPDPPLLINLEILHIKQQHHVTLRFIHLNQLQL